MLVKNPRMEAITFLCICMSLATFGFTHLLRAEHAGRVYSSPHMKINCVATHSSPDVAAHTREVPLLCQHRLGVGKETPTPADEGMHRTHKQVAVLLICSCCLLCVLFRCV